MEALWTKRAIQPVIWKCIKFTQNTNKMYETLSGRWIRRCQHVTTLGTLYDQYCSVVVFLQWHAYVHTKNIITYAFMTTVNNRLTILCSCLKGTLFYCCSYASLRQIYISVLFCPLYFRIVLSGFAKLHKNQWRIEKQLFSNCSFSKSTCCDEP